MEIVKSGQFDFNVSGLKMNINIPLMYFPGMELRAWNPSENGLEVVGVEVSLDIDRDYWEPMRKRELPQKKFVRFVLEEKDRTSCMDVIEMDSPIYFRILLKELSENYSFRLVDRLHGDQLWNAATNRQFTDVEFVVGGTSYHAHRVIVAARSAHFAKLFSSEIGMQSEKYEIEHCDPCASEQLLFFVYTGSLQASADNSTLLPLAREYGIDTLATICERALETSLQVTDDDLLGYMARLSFFFLG